MNFGIAYQLRGSWRRSPHSTQMLRVMLETRGRGAGKQHSRGRYAKCGQPYPQKECCFLESSVRGNAQALFGELRHEVACVAIEPEQSGLNPMCCHRYPTRTCPWSNSRVGSFWDNEASPERVVINPRGEIATASIKAVGS